VALPTGEAPLGWPSTSSALTWTLRRLSPNLLARGIELRRGRRAGGMRVHFVELRMGLKGSAG
jgi:hypothetical protein